MLKIMRIPSVMILLMASTPSVAGQQPPAAGPVMQEAYFKASNAETRDLFGEEVAISGDTIVIGTSKEDSQATGVNGDGSDNTLQNSGAAYVFVRQGGTWVEQAYLKASNTDGESTAAAAGDSFGRQIGISGDTIIIGATGEDSAATGINGDQSDNSASSAGAAYIFVREGGTWTQQAYLKASNTDPGDQFGFDVAICGDTAVVSSANEASSATGVNGDQSINSSSSSGSGAAYVFVREGGTWTQQAYLKASNTGPGDRFGSSLAIDGDTIVVSSHFEDSSLTGVNPVGDNNAASGSGSAYVFVRDGTTWSQQAYIKASNTQSNDEFGASLSLSGDTLVIGAPGEDGGVPGINGDQSDNSAGVSGAAYVFVRDGTTWSQQAYIKASNPEFLDAFAASVSVTGNTLIAGAFMEDSNATGIDGDQSDNSLSRAGAVYVFNRVGTTWAQQAYVKASNSDHDDRFGLKVAASGDTFVVGAIQEGSNAVGVNGPQDNNLSIFSGAAYGFHVGPPECFLVIGEGAGTSPFQYSPTAHEFTTQVGTIVEWHPVLMEDIPEFVIGEITPAKSRPSMGSGGAPVPDEALGTLDAPVNDLSPVEFNAQVLMWNPQVFPSLPEQSSHGLAVRVFPSGRVATVPYGASVGGMTIWAETDTNAQGQKVLRFPFSIAGL